MHKNQIFSEFVTQLIEKFTEVLVGQTQGCFIHTLCVIVYPFSPRLTMLNMQFLLRLIGNLTFQA